jgi:hypothetical protein
MSTESHVEKTATENQKSNKAVRQKKQSATGAVLGENVHFNETLQKTLDEGVADIIGQAKGYRNNTPASQAGYVAEADHGATFNARKALERDSTRAVREPNGTNGDYKIVKGDKTLVKGEVKYHCTADKTETAMRGYGDRQRVGPADQMDEVTKIADQKAAKNASIPKENRQQVAREHQEVSQNAGDCITDGKTKSTPRTLDEARKRAKDATHDRITPRDTLPPLGESVKLAAKSGAKSGAIAGSVIAGTVSGFQNTKAWLNGEKDGEEALYDAAKDVSFAACDGGVKGAAGSVTTVVATRVAATASSSVAKTVLRSGAPAAIAIGAVEVGKSAFALASGDIDGEEFVEETKRTVAVSAGGWGGAKVGICVGSCFGPAGAFVGGVVGGVAGALGVGAFFS